jgi:hypothetical protein
VITLKERHYLPSPEHPSLIVKGKLYNTRTVDLDEEISVPADAAKLDAFQVVYCGGTGLLCTERAAAILRQLADPAWYSFDELTAEAMSGTENG